jgi:ketosteroid isomerase-like protein
MNAILSALRKHTEATMDDVHQQIAAMVNRETEAWDAQDVSGLVDLFHPDMVWPWPRTPMSHDPADWVLEFGHYDRERWGQAWQQLFDSHTLVHNRRVIAHIAISNEGDGAFAVVDIDTLWHDAQGQEQHWHGRVCKVYTKVGDNWKITMHTGVLDYSTLSSSLVQPYGGSRSTRVC